jgi:hypothetical protein
VSFPASCNGFLGGSGTDTLIVGGYPVLVDATLADSNLPSIINATGVVAEARRYLFAVLIPADGYAPQTAHGILSHSFGIQRDGSVTFDPSVAGHCVLTIIPRLEIHGPTHSRFLPTALARVRGCRAQDQRPPHRTGVVAAGRVPDDTAARRRRASRPG